jgi:C-terminal processing protease CtpA/Prc
MVAVLRPLVYGLVAIFALAEAVPGVCYLDPGGDTSNTTLASTGVATQGITPSDEYLVSRMLRDAHDAVKQHYYDLTFHGADLEARYREYDEKLKSATSLNDGLTMVAGFLNGLRDSHTYFVPPRRPYKIDYGYRVAPVGDHIFVTRVRPGTDASGKVTAGDQLLALDGAPVTRETFEAAEYRLNILAPRPVTRLTLRNPAGIDREVVVDTKVVPQRQIHDMTSPGADLDIADQVLEQQGNDHLVRQQVAELGDVMIWKMPIFLGNNGDIDKLFAVARRHKTLILDLRGNPGGLLDTMRRMVSNLIDHDVTIADQVTRNDRSKLVAKTRGTNAYAGRLIVLIDSGSASSAELLARVVQLENRGMVIGDRSAGAVMETRYFLFNAGGALRILYQFAVTAANLIMMDGKSLEGVGVIPDEVALPAPADMAVGRDPVLSHAAQLAGLSLSPVAAGLLFPFEWIPFGPG